mmetsp:Transcript_18751/g.33641  ORF Transcript_18751/g.33641 Transcript_18751/m.33641 type:complete len:84 (+) Transcript_18751:49-300(+)
MCLLSDRLMQITVHKASCQLMDSAVKSNEKNCNALLSLCAISPTLPSLSCKRHVTQPAEVRASSVTSGALQSAHLRRGAEVGR